VTGISAMATGGGSGAAVAAGASAGAIVAKTAVSVSAFSLMKAVIAGAALGVITVQARERWTNDSHDPRSANHPAAAQHVDEPATRTRRLPDHGIETANPAVGVAPPLVQDEQGREGAAIDSSPATRASPILAPSARAQSSAGRTATTAHVEATPSMSTGPVHSLTPDETPAAALTAANTASALPPAAATLTGEIARLDRSRAALRQGAPGRAMWELDGYDAEFANGSLRQEAAVLRIEVLVELGDDARARALANAFAADHPTSGYLTKIGELLARGRKQPAP